MSKQYLYDIEEMQYAVNYDGTKPRGEYIKELDCWCCPEGCGGCVDVWKHYSERDYYTMADRRKIRRIKRRGGRTTI